MATDQMSIFGNFNNTIEKALMFYNKLIIQNIPQVNLK